MTEAHPGRPNPYVGPRAFMPGEKLYGRNREVLQLLDLLIAERIVLLYSRSGAGKTSLIQAALLPELEKKKFQVLPVARVSLEPPPDTTLPSTVNRYVLSVLLSIEEDLPEEKQRPLAELAGMTLATYLDRRRAEKGEPGRLILIFDQFEEILQHPTDQADKEAFFAQVGEVLQDRRRWALFSMREDYVAGLDSFKPLLPTRLRATFRLDLLGEDAARQAIREPARQAGVDFTDDATQKLVNDLCLVRIQQRDGTTIEQVGPYVEPVQLQVVCQSLWEGLPKGVTVITSEHLQTFGDVNQALAGFYERCIKRATQGTGAKEATLRAWLEDQLITPAGTRGTVYRGRTRTGVIPNAAVDVLENLHLIRGEMRAGARWYELTHDRFIGPIQKSNAAWRALRRGRWQRAAAVLSAVLVIVIVGASALVTGGASLTAGQLQATVTASAAELSEVRATATVASEVGERLVRTRPLKAGLSVSGINATAGSIGAFVRDADGVIYFLGSEPAPDSPGSAVVQPGRVDGGEPPDDVVGEWADGLPLRDGVSIAHMVNLVRLDEGISFEVSIPGIGPIRGVRDPAVGMSVRKLGRSSGLTEGTIQQVDVTRTINLGGPEVRVVDAVVAGAMSQGGDRGALVMDDEGYAVGVIVAGSEITTILAPIQEVLDHFNVRLIQVGEELFRLRGHERDVFAVAFSPDGRWLATGSQDSTARLWDVTNPTAEPVVLGHEAIVWAVAFSPGGRWLATGSGDGTVRLWDATNPTAEPVVLRGHEDYVVAVAFSPDGRWLATGSVDNTARLWDATNPTAEPVVLRGHEGRVDAVAFNPDGRWLATGSSDTTARLWDVSNPTAEPVVLRHESNVRAVAFSPDGRWLATGRDDTAWLWDVTNPTAEPVVLRGHERDVLAVAFSPDGRWLATGSDDTTARLWDVTNPTAEPVVLRGHEDTVRAVAFSPDGTRLVTAGGDGTVRIWQVK